MQFLYMKYISDINNNIVENNMLKSIDKLYDLYIFLLNLLLAVRNKAVENVNKYKENNILNNNNIFINNILLNMLYKKVYESSYINNKNLNWEDNDQYIFYLFKKLENWKYYESYINLEKNSFFLDKKFILKYYKTQIISNIKLYEFLEDKYLTWSYDLNIVHKIVYNTLKFANNDDCKFNLYDINKNIKDKNFIISLYRKTDFNKKYFDDMISKISINWDLKRIAILDKIIIHMAICEFIYFSKIPPKVTINEYIEITKVYSTEKSRIFINGILDALLKILISEKKIYKLL